MVRGEKDYTQRMSAAMRRAGIHGDKVLFIDDFEALTLKITDSAGAGTYTLTTAAGTVWNGDQALSMNPTANNLLRVMRTFPLPTPSILSAEFIALPSTLSVSYINLGFDIYTGTHRLSAIFGVSTESGNVIIRYYDSNGDWQTLYTYNSPDLPQAWHYFFMQFDMISQSYRVLQFDNRRFTLKDTGVGSTVNPFPSSGTLFIDIKNSTGVTGSLYVDDLTLSYEEP